HKRGQLAHRAGSEMSSIALFGQRVKIRKPRVRKDDEEIQLESFAKLKSMDNLSGAIFKMMINGISTRSYDDVLQKFENDLGVSKSTVSRQFIKESSKYLNEINSRRFAGHVFWALMIDGIYIGDDVIVVVLGVDMAGEKHFLGVSQGSTENSIIVEECLNRLNDRDIQFADKVVAVLDGAKALRKAVKHRFGDKVAIQRCLNHKVRNIEAKLPKKDRPELKDRMRQAYDCNKLADAKEEFEKIHGWLASISHNASESLLEGLDDLLTLHRIKMPPALRKSFYTTNLIESGFSEPRFKMKRVKRWIHQGDMIKRWAGAALIYQERNFRKVKNYNLIGYFIRDYVNQKTNGVDKSDAA
ncbi:MAG: transposase, partial [Leptospiraceae bacterium]|nr:transposase [Leptospiraceae bacterium]